MNHMTHPVSPADISNFSPEISKLCYIKKYMYRLHFDTKFLIILAFLESLRIVLIKKVTSLMMSAKMATPDLLKITIFWNTGYDVIIYVHDVTNKILSRDSNYIVHVVMWPKFGNSTFLWEKLYPILNGVKANRQTLGSFKNVHRGSKITVSLRRGIFLCDNH